MSLNAIRKNKTGAKISEFTVSNILQWFATWEDVLPL